MINLVTFSILFSAINFKLQGYIFTELSRIKVQEEKTRKYFFESLLTTIIGFYCLNRVYFDHDFAHICFVRELQSFKSIRAYVRNGRQSAF